MSDSVELDEAELEALSLRSMMGCDRTMFESCKRDSQWMEAMFVVYGMGWND